ncbi:MAG: FeoB-associated Cys-rich membrane protein [Oscillospiraceae bacterium]|nr:FeoB-associated Cys-rich membrane protein [Oscillospiraceae bacterium]
MNWLDITIIVLVVAYGAYVLFGKKKHGCCGDCGNCPGCKQGK